jgi:hypothetical protein
MHATTHIETMCLLKTIRPDGIRAEHRGCCQAIDCGDVSSLVSRLTNKILLAIVVSHIGHW